jgi:signal transduction histidine kinase
MNFNSIRTRAILLFVPLVIIPILLLGGFGAVYVQDVLKQDIADNNLAQAKSLTRYVDNYISSSTDYLNSLASRQSLVNAIAGNDTTPINKTLQYGEKNVRFYSLYVTDASGTVISSYPNTGLVGLNFSGEPYVRQVLSTANSTAMAPLANRTGQSAIFLGVPIVDPGGKLLGTMTGEMDPDILGDQVLYSQIKNRQYIYLVNDTGHIIVATNRSYVDERKDYSAPPAVQKVMRGEEGVMDQYNPIEHDRRLAAYSPVRKLGWGVVVAVPDAIAYQPVTNAIWVIGALTIALAIIALAMAYLFSDSIIRPIMGLFEAARAITNRTEYVRYLPLRRKDEIGQVAVCMDKMAQRIEQDRVKIMDEKNRAELYVDIMGHDINNLNQVTLSNLELMIDDSNLTAQQREMITDALNASRGSSGIIDNVRKIQAINEEKGVIEPEDINDMILECIRDAPKPEDKKVTINYTPRKGLVIKGTALMKEVFCNLIYNAIKHSPRDVAIDVRVDETMQGGRKFYDVSVTDNGPGIPDDLKSRLFNRFQRGETKAHGKGLGLFIVKSMVEQVGGDVKVEDRVPGDYSRGAKFVVSLPACEECK